MNFSILLTVFSLCVPVFAHSAQANSQSYSTPIQTRYFPAEMAARQAVLKEIFNTYKNEWYIIEVSQGKHSDTRSEFRVRITFGSPEGVGTCSPSVVVEKYKDTGQWVVPENKLPYTVSCRSGDGN